MKDHKYYLDQWNTLHVRYTKHGAEERNRLMARYCERVILKAKQAYYDTGKPIMTDQTYDWYENRLRLLDPESKVLDKVGN